MLNDVYLSLGSNIEPEINMGLAVQMLARQTRLVALSSVWETRPVGMVDQPNFLNAAALVKTELTAMQLKQRVLTHIEQKLGRMRQVNKNAPRPMDIDIMLFNREIFDLGHRHIPDPELLDRSFVAIPLAEIAPDYVHPETGQTLQLIAEQFKGSLDTMQPRPDISQTLAKFVTQ